MGKRSSKMSKIKSTNMSKQDFINNLNNKKNEKETNEEFINNENINHSENINETNEQNPDIQMNTNNDKGNNDNIETKTKQEDIQENKLNNEEYKKLENENKELNAKLLAQIEENRKLKLALEDERKQLINKLEEKTQAAQKMLEEKKEVLEEEKKKEVEAAKDNIYIDTISNFLDPVILFEQTIKNSPNNPILQSYVQGYTMIVTMFKDRLNNLNVEQIDVNVGDEFNENFMEAFDVEHVDGVEPNKVLKIVSDGFVYKGQRVIKFTSVVVSK